MPCLSLASNGAGGKTINASQSRLRRSPIVSRWPRTTSEANVYTDDLKSYLGIPNPQATVRHSAGEYVNCMAHTNGIESFWSTLKQAYHVVSHKHLDRYVGQFVAKHNLRDEDTGEQMGMVAGGMMGRRLSYRRLTGRGAA